MDSDFTSGTTKSEQRWSIYSTCRTAPILMPRTLRTRIYLQVYFRIWIFSRLSLSIILFVYSIQSIHVPSIHPFAWLPVFTSWIISIGIKKKRKFYSGKGDEGKEAKEKENCRSNNYILCWRHFYHRCRFPQQYFGGVPVGWLDFSCLWYHYQAGSN